MIKSMVGSWETAIYEVADEDLREEERCRDASWFDDGFRAIIEQKNKAYTLMIQWRHT